MEERKLKFDTLQVHGGQEVDSATGSRAVPIYQTSSYVFNSVEHGANLFALTTGKHVITANKAVVAKHMKEFIDLANKK